MKKLITFLATGLLTASVLAQNIDLSEYPPVWSNDVLSNSIVYAFPFEDTSEFEDAAIYFEKKENSNYITLRYRAFPYSSPDNLGIKGVPTMLIKLGDGTVLSAKKERIIKGIVNAQYVIDVYFNLDLNLQQKIIKSGIEKARIAYNYSIVGISKNKIFDAYTKNSTIEGISIIDLILQVKNANISEAKEKAKKNNLDYNF